MRCLRLWFTLAFLLKQNGIAEGISHNRPFGQFSKKRKFDVKPVLDIPRGGAAADFSSNALLAAKVATVTSLGGGSLSWLVPKTTGKCIGIIQADVDDTDLPPMVEIMMTCIGSCLLSIGIMGYVMFFYGGGTGTTTTITQSERYKLALILSYIPFTINSVRNWLWNNGSRIVATTTKVLFVQQQQQQPLSSNILLFRIAMNTFMSLIIYKNVKYAMLAAKLWSGFVLLTGLFFMVDPKSTVAAAWGVVKEEGSTTTTTTSPMDLYLLQVYGILLCHTQFVVLALINGNLAPNKIYGFGTLLSCIFFLTLELWIRTSTSTTSTSTSRGGGEEKNNVVKFSKNLQTIWTILVSAILTGTMLLG